MSVPARPRPDLRDEKWLIEQLQAAIAAHAAREDPWEPGHLVEHTARMQWYAEELAAALRKRHADERSVNNG